jgi:trigger factor
VRVEVKDLAPWRRELLVELPPEEAAERRSRIYEAFRRKAKLPGFRPGKAPLALVERTYGPAIESEFLETVSEDVLREALTREGLEPLEPASAQLPERYEAGEMMRFTATVDVRPRIEIRGYEGLAVERVVYDVEDSDIETFLEELRDRNATFEPIADRGGERGDYMAIRYRELDPDRRPAPGTSDRETVLELGREGLLPEFENGLLGARTGEERQITVSYPADFDDARLRGRIVTYGVQVLDLRRREVPPLDEAFARRVADVASLEELRAKAREELRIRADNEADRRVEEAVLDRVLEINPFEPPELWVERGIEGVLSEFRQDRPEVTEEDVRKVKQGVRDQVIRRLRRDMAVEAIGRQESIDVGGDDLGRGVQALAQRTGRGVKETAEDLRDSGRLRRLAESLFEQKTLERLVSKSQVTTVTRPKPRGPESPAKRIIVP